MPNPYYHTCPNCGSNLDPEETCDCVRQEADAMRLFNALCDEFKYIVVAAMEQLLEWQKGRSAKHE